MNKEELVWDAINMLKALIRVPSVSREEDGAANI